MGGKVSIVVPVYNVENYLEVCLNSLMSQVYENIEIILIDDGSTDSSRTIIKRYADKDTRIKYLFQDNSGPSNARNKGIDLASGNYLVFIDSDDWVEKDMVANLVREFDNELVDIVLCDYFLEAATSFYQKIIDENVKSVEMTEYLKCLLLSTDKLNSQCNRMYKSNIIKNNKIYFREDLIVGEDQIFNIEYFKFVNKAIYVPRALYHYRVVKNSTCRRIHPDQVDMLITQQKIRNDLFNGWGMEDLNYQLGSSKWFLQTTAAYCFLCLNSLSLKESYSMIYRFLSNETCRNCFSYIKKNKIEFDSNVHKFFIPLIRLQKVSLIIIGFYIFKMLFIFKKFLKTNL